MDDPEKKRQQEVALFRYGLLADLVHLAPNTRGLYKLLQEKASKTYSIPHSDRARVAQGTLLDWLKKYRKGGFDALLPRPRADTGKTRSLPQEVADLLLALKEETPALSVHLLCQQAKASGKVPEGVLLPLSTVHRLFSRHGLMEKDALAPSGKDHRRFCFPKAGDLWMSDVMHGPAVRVGDKQKRKTYLIAFLDDTTRVIPYAAFALSESTQAFLPVLKQALLRRGLPKRLYVDNGAAYRSHHLSLVCAKLGIALIHARPYHPQGKGKQERFFRTVRLQLLPRLSETDLQSLEALNRRLWAYVEGEYHHTPHRGLEGETPLDQWAKTADEVKYVDPVVDLDDLFLHEAKRKVQKDRLVSLHGVAYEVEAALVGSVVTLRYDPNFPKRALQVLAKDHPPSLAKPVDVYANCFVKRDRPSQTLSPSEPPAEPPVGLRLSDLYGQDETKEER